MSTIEHSVDVNVPVRVAYDQWTQFESFPEFMEGVESVKQLTDTRTAWITEIAGVRREFEAEISEQHPDERIAWHSVDKPRQAGVVTFHRLDENTTRVTLQMEYDPEGFLETAADWLQIVRMRVRNDVQRFKEFIESRGGATGAWRGDVPGPHQHGSGLDTGGSMPPRSGDPMPPGSGEPVLPGSVGGSDYPPGTGTSPTLPPPGPLGTHDDPPQPPRPVL
ncbi:SRPBCC family protein [Nonomuraea sp. 3-1Str]|uniref:SRPBCC family protein n=1 Tax=Nonomuraea sp. 3-1Str TaxID=2929801 RepID=UPI002863E979|nr:SRPBCC family protein [Nonomuraea sp. 3-1Str]MDR8411657.1 SRPBCC family protein [Nonomuraea sp. 3-1Str]